MKLYIKIIFLLTLCSLFTACSSTKKPLPTAPYVDLPSFMGTWYVVGYTPILVDKEAHNAIEHYYLEEDGKIKTTYQFRDGGFDGKIKTYRPTGSVFNEETNAEWRMQFIWPFQAAYLVLHYDQEKGETIIGHPNRKYCWIMLREPNYSDETYDRLLDKLYTLGYSKDLIQKLPQDWSNESVRSKMMQDASPFAIPASAAEAL